MTSKKETSNLDLGIIGNCQFSALVSRSGNIEWLCWPRFDSNFIFGSLLDRDRGGSFQICSEEGGAGRQEYMGNTNVLRTVFECQNGSFELIDFAPRFQQYNRYFKPKTLIRIVRPLQGRPRCKVQIDAKLNYGEKSSPQTLGSNHIAFAGYEYPMRLTSNAPLTYISCQKSFVVDRPFYFALTFGQPIEADLEEVCLHFMEKTCHYWETWVKHCHLPTKFQAEVIRSALVLKLHQFEDTGAIIAATTTSIPEAEGTERNWDYRFCWIRDAMFSLAALRRLTHFEELEKFVLYLQNLVEDSRQKDYFIQPVYAIDGNGFLIENIIKHLDGYLGNPPVRVGNQAYEHLQYDVYGEILLAISPIFLDKRFSLEKEIVSLDVVDKIIDQIERYLISPDAGLWEFRGKAQIHTFTLLMNWAGLFVGERIFADAKQNDRKSRCSNLRRKIESFIEENAWNETVGSYTQAVGGDDFDASLLMMINMGYLKKEDPKSHQLVDKIRENLSHPCGLLHRYVAADDFGKTDNAFLICSFWLVEALAHLDRRQEAIELLETLLQHNNHLGLYSEDVNPKTGTLWGNFPQTYSHVGLINAVFTLFPNRGILYLEDEPSDD
ncbi:glycoside hydrolase family 15 protein [Pseudobacteriovorax antillogorgiicola]|uniref:Glucoamylase (Glucan-1,4-alpha-glucosidase), GH15 family n=1 Tax=Pseudobacteriovorax antillogorgiicola TaxID=1513793 RepID=A0A1Y6BEI5_9BACT|nr:glycoside hydrolase family 15 protein [Pseudobacteriovorax antillogorgiicola]TCS57473.1 GH15 family glucan-1,4-alpha-glucosidase [Pseudobacteriovorax antillogorgiicola]SMF00588.1 Glucoamylase (glucan-1,4-alpha-glucosidase), GH15 family [Pseudobacteriovorax antillogorgiicola]